MNITAKIQLYCMLCLTLLLSCDVKTCYPDAENWPYTHFNVKADKTSPLGYKIDDPKNELNIQAIDETLLNVVACMKPLDPLTTQERAAAICTEKPLYQIRSCLIVKDAPNWTISSCSGAQVFECGDLGSACLDKGLTPTSQCPCRCRALNQDYETIITAPNLELLPWTFVTLMSGCYRIDKIQRFQTCAAPSQRPEWFTKTLK